MQNNTMTTSVSSLVLNTDEISIKDELENESKSTTYRVKNYTQRKLFKNFSKWKANYIAVIKMIAIIIALIIAIMIIHYQSINFKSIQALNTTLGRITMDNSNNMNYLILNKTNSERTETINTNNHGVNTSNTSDPLTYNNFYQEIILKDGNKLWVYHVTNESAELLYQNKNYIESVESDYATKKIYVSQFNGTFTNVLVLSERLNMNDEYRFDVIFEDMRVKLERIAFDNVGKNLYMVDKSRGLLIILDVKTNQFNILLSDLLQPSNILLDSSKGKMFILQASHSILKGNMNGEHLSTITEQSGITLLALDRDEQRVYWVNELIGIESSDYEGRNIRHFATDTATILDLTVINNQLFWLWKDHHHSALHQLISCQIDDGNCEGHVMRPLSSLSNPDSIYFFPMPMQQSNRSITHPCQNNNGHCQQLCLAAPNATRSCACKLGWQLNPDKKTCRESRDFILYATDAHTIRGRTLDVTRKILTDVILPTPFYIESLEQKIIIDYNQHQDVCYFSEGKNIFKMELGRYQNQTMIVNRNEYTITDITYDWATKNLYIMEYNVENAYDDEFRYQITQLNINDVVVQPYHMLQFDIYGVFDIRMAVYPEQNNIFYFERHDRDSEWPMQKMSITSEVNLPFGSLCIDVDIIQQHGRPIAIDYQDHRLYWIQSLTPNTKLRQATFDGQELKMLTVDIVSPNFIVVYRQWLFLSNLTDIWRFNKDDGRNAVKIVPQLIRQGNDVPFIRDMRLISDAIQSSH